MKGAPDRVLARCSKILVRGEEQELNEYWQKKIQKANDKFADMGERVLGIAKIELDPKIYTKDPAYPFDVTDWRTW